MLEEAQKRLKIASKATDPWELGYAHLEVSFALLQRSTEWLEFQKDAKDALSQADMAIDTFSSIPYPGGIANAHLARASIYTELANGEEDELKIAAGVDRALTSCLAAQAALNAEGVHYGQIFDIYSSVSVLLLQLRGMVEDQEFQDHLEKLISANSKLLGMTVAEDIILRDEGDSILYTAQMFGALAVLEEDEEEKKELLETKSLLALQAGLWLGESSDNQLIEQTLDTYQEAWTVLEMGAEIPMKSKKDPSKCHQCGSANPPGAKFCNECGAAQKKGG